MQKITFTFQFLIGRLKTEEGNLNYEARIVSIPYR